ncbi:SSrecog-domain-containing protein [Metschnikowia bicuspidata var. bicuspidata NRRL YB-4993]|uniref:FACT complex subunit POB3 n=1 Tax=Metschnikowia bicuspidata var. bicuspidata NRRL YB-4993 TaxID=869754 RepID=A0A1A0HET4_9ASCO|nr:SSrecog-domain-containing protein [Metschnikowia bicuspidata var. bicuspidata NRRL YB-4993]OBA22511.1 SSrecog-domain-containing protein [Metschnikowia bicuspidata var. bicuspidata NRRL YB-4993]
MVNIDFEKIHLNQLKLSGRMRIADLGLGWKAASTAGAPPAPPFLLPSEELLGASWSRGLRAYELRVQTKNQGVLRLDGFDSEDFLKLKQELQRNFHLAMEHREHSLRGWNWGSADLARNELVFQVHNKPSFEIPYLEVTNLNLTGKNEVALELTLNNDDKAGDELVEMRLYIPGTVASETTTTVRADDGSEKQEDGVEEASAASVFYDQLKDKAAIGQVAGEAVVSFSDVLFLTPRGRYDIDMYPGSLRLRGKTYDYKIQYKQIERVFSLPKPDDIHHLVVLQIDPPLRQGQTRYPFLVLQFTREEETELELNLADSVYDERYKDRLKKLYDSQTHLVMAHCLKGLTERRLVVPGAFQSRFLQAGVACSLKASEGYLYPLDRCFLFVTKPTVYIPYSEVSSVTMSRTSTGVSASRTFDLEVNLRGGNQTHTFANIDKEEQETIENFCKDRGLRIKNEEKMAKAMLAKAMTEEADDDDDDADVDMGSAGEDESDDDDFGSGSDSDVAEEFDSDAPASDSDADMEEAAANTDERPPKKKAKN